MVVRLDASAPGWLLLCVAVTARPSRVLMGPADGGIHIDLPADQPGRVRSGCKAVRIAAQVPARCHPLLICQIPAPHKVIMSTRDHTEINL